MAGRRVSPRAGRARASPRSVLADQLSASARACAESVRSTPAASPGSLPTSADGPGAAGARSLPEQPQTTRRRARRRWRGAQVRFFHLAPHLLASALFAAAAAPGACGRAGLAPLGAACLAGTTALQLALGLAAPALLARALDMRRVRVFLPHVQARSSLPGGAAQWCAGNCLPCHARRAMRAPQCSDPLATIVTWVSPWLLPSPCDTILHPATDPSATAQARASLLANAAKGLPGE